MSDLVERLRRRHEQAAENYGELDLTLWSEAADEIERLRGINDRMSITLDAEMARAEKAEAERDEYRSKGAAHIRMLAVNNDELRAEIERLRADVTMSVEALERIGKQSPEHRALVEQVWKDVSQ